MDKAVFNYISADSRSPGPAAYCIKPTIGKEATDPTIEKNPKYSLLARRDNRIKCGPSPLEYETMRLNRFGKDRAIGGLMSMVLPQYRIKQTPGPADYCIQPEKLVGGPKMQKDKGCIPKPKMWPGPNTYQLPSTLDKRWTHLGKKIKPPFKCPTPAPNHYEITKADLYMPGTFNKGRLLGVRLYDCRTACSPGPADYFPKQLKCRLAKGKDHECRTTFSMRRPDTQAPFIVLADNECVIDYC